MRGVIIIVGFISVMSLVAIFSCGADLEIDPVNISFVHEGEDKIKVSVFDPDKNYIDSKFQIYMACPLGNGDYGNARLDFDPRTMEVIAKTKKIPNDFSISKESVGKFIIWKPRIFDCTLYFYPEGYGNGGS